MKLSPRKILFKDSMVLLASALIIATTPAIVATNPSMELHFPSLFPILIGLGSLVYVIYENLKKKTLFN